MVDGLSINLPRRTLGFSVNLPQYGGKNILTSVKTMRNRKGGFPSAFPGEKHPMSLTKSRITGKKGMYFNSFLGPNTNVRARLIRGDKPISRADRAGKRHDIDFALANNPRDLRVADKRFIRTLKRLERSGEPKINTRIGIHGIRLKNRLEDAGVMSKRKFLNPFPKKDKLARSIAKRERSKLAQQGYGTRRSLPAEMLKEKILRLSRKGKGIPKGKHSLGINVPDFLTRGLTPLIIKAIGKKIRIVRKFGKSMKDSLKREIRRKIKGIKHKGGFWGALASIGLPIATSLASAIIPKIIGLFTRKKGSGILDIVRRLGQPLMKKLGMLIVKAINAKRRGLSGSGFFSNIKNALSKFAKVFVSIAGPLIKDVGLPVFKDIVVPLISKKITGRKR